MSERYQNTAAPGLKPLLEERESVRFLQTLETFVLSPSFSNAGFGALMALGAALCLGYYEYGFFLLLLGAPCFGWGAFGWLMLQRRLREYQPERTNSRKEFEGTIQPAQARERSAEIKGKTIPFDRPSLTLSYGNLKHKLTGKELDKIQSIYEGGDMFVRRDTSANGIGWGDKENGIGISSVDFGIVTKIMKDKEYITEQGQWTDKGLRNMLDVEI